MFHSEDITGTNLSLRSSADTETHRGLQRLCASTCACFLQRGFSDAAWTEECILVPFFGTQPKTHNCETAAACYPLAPSKLTFIPPHCVHIFRS